MLDPATINKTKEKTHEVVIFPKTIIQLGVGLHKPLGKGIYDHTNGGLAFGLSLCFFPERKHLFVS
jgi:hypothetical protein